MTATTTATKCGHTPRHGGEIVEASRTVSADSIDVSALDRYLEAA